ncbi:MAG: MmcQ/YjbR family DNA-binding protein, partial [Candidatus Dormibacteraceae bacterium]
MVTSEEARALALRLPETVEQDHHGRPSFRIQGRIFATLWTDRVMNVMPGEEHIRWATREFPGRCQPVHWGRRLAAVGVDLDRVDATLLQDLLDLAWTYKAPAR